MREVALGEKTPPEKICRSKSTNQEGVHSAHRTDLCFSICRFSQVVFIPQAQPHAQSLFLFPIVFGINRIPRNPHTLLVRRACPLKLIKLKIKTFHFLQGSRSQSFTFLAKVTKEEVFYGGQPPSSKQTSRSTTGIERETQTEWRREEPGACVFYHAKAAFFKPTEVQSRTKFLNGVICGFERSTRKQGS